MINAHSLQPPGASAHPDDRRRAVRPNALQPGCMNPAERRVELCAILGAGLVRLNLRGSPELSAEMREFTLHNALEQSGSADPTHWRTA